MYATGHPLNSLEQLLHVQFHEDWRDEYEDEWEAAEDSIATFPAESLRGVRAGIEYLMSTYPDASERFALMADRSVFLQEHFDTWLRAVSVRIEQRLAGDDSEPLAAPT